MSAVTKSKEDLFQETELYLQEWSKAVRWNNQLLGLPTSSMILHTIEHVRRETRKQKNERRRHLKKTRRAKKEGDPPTDPKDIAEEYGFSEKDLTAQGKEKHIRRETSVQFNSNVIRMDYLVARLPGWMNQSIMRSYLYQQPDRRAAQDLRMPKDAYRARRIASVEYLGEMWTQRVAGHCP